MQTITITRTETRQGAKGAYTLAHLQGGKRAYVWDRELAQALAPGVYEAELEERGGFLRLRSARPIASANGAQAPTEAQAPAQASTQERLQALQVVAALAPWLRLESMDQVLQAADRVLAWLQGGEG